MDKKSEFKLAQSLDQTNLNPLLSIKECIKFLEESRKYNFSSVAILPIYTKLAAEILEGSNTKVCTAISYPLGGVPSHLKAKEVEYAVKAGADEIDYVVNMAAIKSGDYKKIFEESQTIVSAAKGKPVKVIIEIWNLTEIEIKLTCKAVIQGGVSFVKSSTGFEGYKNIRATTIEDALLLRDIVKQQVKIKMAGGIKDIKFTQKLLSLGVDRIGTSSGVQIIRGFRKLE